MLDAAGVDAVARAEFAVFADQEFRHHEEIHGGKIVVNLAVGVRNFGDHHMDDVVGEVLIAAGNEDFGAGDAIGAVGLFHRAGLHQAQIGAATGFRQAHGAGPFARDHFGNQMLPHPVRPGGDQRAIGGGSEAGIHRQRLVGGHRHFAHRHAHHHRHVRAAMLSGGREAAPTAFAIGAISFLEALGRAHHAILEVTTFFVPGLVDGLQDLLAEFPRIGENVVDQLGREVAELRQVTMLFRFQEFMNQKAVILDRRMIDWHGCVSLRPRFLYAEEGK